MTDRTTVTILWQHDGARQREVVVDAVAVAFAGAHPDVPRGRWPLRKASAAPGAA